MTIIEQPFSPWQQSINATKLARVSSGHTVTVDLVTFEVKHEGGGDTLFNTGNSSLVAALNDADCFIDINFAEAAVLEKRLAAAQQKISDLEKTIRELEYGKSMAGIQPITYHPDTWPKPFPELYKADVDTVPMITTIPAPSVGAGYTVEKDDIPF